MMTRLSSLLADRRGTAAAEMALVTPLLITLMFGSMEMGNYFLDQHAVTKAVRDGARYAGRMSITNFTCTSGSATGTIGGGVTKIKNMTRLGNVAGTGSPRLPFWIDAATITITVRCVAKASYGTTFSALPGDVPVVKVSASVPYANGSLFKRVGFRSVDLTLNAESEATVMGI
jgi:hypothetical protein